MNISLPLLQIVKEQKMSNDFCLRLLLKSTTKQGQHEWYSESCRVQAFLCILPALLTPAETHTYSWASGWSASSGGQGVARSLRTPLPIGLNPIRRWNSHRTVRRHHGGVTSRGHDRRDVALRPPNSVAGEPTDPGRQSPPLSVKSESRPLPAGSQGSSI